MSPWATWRGLWRGVEAPTAMALVRILLASCLLYDLVLVGQHHLVTPLWGPLDAGGFGDALNRSEPVELAAWTGGTARGIRWAWRVLVVAVTCVAVGLFTRPMALLTVVLSAQFARILPDADRGIDMLIRNVFCIFVAFPSGRCWGLDAVLFGRCDTIPAWPRRLLVLQLAGVYFAAGVQKTAVAWWPWGDFSALYIVLQDPAVARVPLAGLARLYPLTQLATALTMLFEWGAWVVPLAAWYRSTRVRGGRLRAWFNRLDVRTVWVPMGVALHLGIAATLQIGIFPWAMLALYPAFFHPDELRAFWRRRGLGG